MWKFHTLVPTYKWFEKHRNIAAEDVVFIWYSEKYGEGDYRVLVKVEVDSDILVRTCGVRYSTMGVAVKYFRTAVQSLVLILPVEEQHDDVVPVTQQAGQLQTSESGSGGDGGQKVNDHQMSKEENVSV